VEEKAAIVTSYEKGAGLAPPGKGKKGSRVKGGEGGRQRGKVRKTYNLISDLSGKNSNASHEGIKWKLEALDRESRIHLLTGKGAQEVQLKMQKGKGRKRAASFAEKTSVT